MYDIGLHRATKYVWACEREAGRRCGAHRQAHRMTRLKAARKVANVAMHEAGDRYARNPDPFWARYERNE